MGHSTLIILEHEPRERGKMLAVYVALLYYYDLALRPYLDLTWMMPGSVCFMESKSRCLLS